MKKTYFLKTLFVAACLLVGVNAWAEAGDVTTNADIDFSNAISAGVVTGTVNSMTIGGSSYIDTDNWLRLVDGKSTITIPEAQRAGSKDVVNIKFKMGWGNKNNMGSTFEIKDAENAALASFRFARWDGNKKNSNTLNIDMSGLYGAAASNAPIKARYTLFDITINYASNTITSVVFCSNTDGKGTTRTETFVSTLTNTNPVATFEISGFGVGGNTDRADAFDELVITTTEGDYSVSSADYTINWVCDETIVKTTTRNGVVGSTITLLASDKEKFLTNEGTKKYSYVSDDSSEKTIADNGSTVVTITCEEIGKYDYSVTTSVSSVIEEGTLFNDETKTVSWSKYIEKDGDYYQATAPFQFTVTKDAASHEVSVTPSQVTQFAETTSSNWASTGFDNANLSGGKAYRGVSGGVSKTMLTVAETGTYSINYAVFSTNTGSGKEFDFSLYKNDASVDANLIETFSVNHSVNYVLTTGTRTVDNVILLAGDKIIVKSGNTTCAFDYIALAKTGDATVSKSISAAGYATFCSPYALDFSTTGLTAYIATATADKVSFEEVTSVPANTGVLLKGDADTYNIPVVASSATDVTANVLVGVTEATPIDAEAGFVLMGSPKVGFYKNKNTFTVGANTAYIPVANIPNEGRSFIGFDDETTGIADVRSKTEEGRSDIYNLNGQRVEKAQKGLYIQNGKKFVVK